MNRRHRKKFIRRTARHTVHLKYVSSLFYRDDPSEDIRIKQTCSCSVSSIVFPPPPPCCLQLIYNRKPPDNLNYPVSPGGGGQRKKPTMIFHCHKSKNKRHKEHRHITRGNNQAVCMYDRGTKRSPKRQTGSHEKKNPLNSPLPPPPPSCIVCMTVN